MGRTDRTDGTGSRAKPLNIDRTGRSDGMCRMDRTDKMGDGQDRENGRDGKSSETD